MLYYKGEEGAMEEQYMKLDCMKRDPKQEIVPQKLVLGKESQVKTELFVCEQ